MKLPNIAHSPELHEGGRVAYFVKKLDYGDLNQKAKWATLPNWLVDLINRETKKAYWQGYNECQANIKKALGVRL
jgi:hypothetical protein